MQTFSFPPIVFKDTARGVLSQLLGDDNVALNELCNGSSFNPKPKATACSGIDAPHVAPAIAFGFGLDGLLQDFGGEGLERRSRKRIAPAVSHPGPAR
ncbi:MAG: hypothetical protein H8E44_15420 [Planctomycetes bacterium]|nr:hypothetical protein [Planctomycetota bacterium]MBL7040521.1 hypothetical protein [Pirellulaceae bacterium]